MLVVLIRAIDPKAQNRVHAENHGDLDVMDEWRREQKGHKWAA
jgi:hypothetical protein